jgi:hypothetical protein
VPDIGLEEDGEDLDAMIAARPALQKPADESTLAVKATILAREAAARAAPAANGNGRKHVDITTMPSYASDVSYASENDSADQFAHRSSDAITDVDREVSMNLGGGFDAEGAALARRGKKPAPAGRSLEMEASMMMSGFRRTDSYDEEDDEDEEDQGEDAYDREDPKHHEVLMIHAKIWEDELQEDPDAKHSRRTKLSTRSRRMPSDDFGDRRSADSTKDDDELGSEPTLAQLVHERMVRKMPFFIADPSSKWRQLWDVVGSWFLFVDLVMIPLQAVGSLFDLMARI